MTGTELTRLKEFVQAFMGAWPHIKTLPKYAPEMTALFRAFNNAASACAMIDNTPYVTDSDLPYDFAGLCRMIVCECPDTFDHARNLMEKHGIEYDLQPQSND